MDIRKANEADFDVILAIYNQAIPTHQVTGDLTFATRESRQTWFDFHLNSEKYPLWVGVEDNKVIGWFSFSPFYDRAGFAYSSEISIYLDEKAKGKGYGSKMLTFMQDNMLAHGINVLTAYVFELNQVSYQLMKKHGFDCWGRFPNLANMGKDEQGKHKWRTLLLMGYQKGIED